MSYLRSVSICCGLALLNPVSNAEVPPPDAGHPGGGGVSTGPIHARSAALPLYPVCDDGTPRPSIALYPFSIPYTPNDCSVWPIGVPTLPAERNVEVVFIGNSWGDQNFAADKISGIDSFFYGWNNSDYSKLLSEYEWVGGKEGKKRAPLLVRYRGHLFDSLPDQVLDRENDSEQMTKLILTRVCSAISKGKLPIGEDDKESPWNVFAYTSSKRPHTEMSCGFRAYRECTVNQKTTSLITLSVIYDADQDPQCEVNDVQTGHSPGLASIANSTAALLADDFNDWDWTGWYDWQNQEIADKCAWLFNHESVFFPNGTFWKLQALWSNNAYEQGRGSIGLFGLPGCLDGTYMEDVGGK